MSIQVSKEEWFRSIIAQYEQRLIRYSARIAGGRRRCCSRNYAAYDENLLD